MVKNTGGKKLTHVRDVNNYIRGKIIDGTKLTVEEDRDNLIRDFLDTYGDSSGKVTPELFAFFLQKINAHALFEEMDNTGYGVVYPTYVPFDVEEVAAKFGYKNLYQLLHTRLIQRSRAVGSTKTAAAAAVDLGGISHFDKAASAGGITDKTADREDNPVVKQLRKDQSIQEQVLRDKAASMCWSLNNMEQLAKDPVFRSNPEYVRIYEDINKGAVRGGRDKTGGLAELNRILDIFDEIIALKN